MRVSTSSAIFEEKGSSRELLPPQAGPKRFKHHKRIKIITNISKTTDGKDGIVRYKPDKVQLVKWRMGHKVSTNYWQLHRNLVKLKMDCNTIPVLYVQVHLKEDCTVPFAAIRDEVTQWLRQPPRLLNVYQTIEPNGLIYQTLVHQIYVANLERSSAAKLSSDQVELNVQIVIFHNEPPSRLSIESNEKCVQLRQTLLPHQELHRLEECLVYEDDLTAKLIRFASRIVSFGIKLDSKFIYFNRLILLHGPSGTGKSTLCRVVAQALSIRLRRNYAKFLLWELDANAMFSSWFGESSSLVDATFEAAFGTESDTFVCIVIDEIESLASSREQSLGVDVTDSARATNQLLIVLDRLRQKPNVMLMCTSNLMSAIDPAFLDRVDLKQYVPRPSLESAYLILQSGIGELMRAGIIHDETWNIESQTKLKDICTRCTLSGRALRRLPYLAVALHGEKEIVTLQEALVTLSKAIDDQLVLDSTT